MTTMRESLEPFDEFNQTLQAHVHPPDYTNPRPSGRYNLVVIGAGVAGLVTASGAAGVGAKVALIERGLMGGDCLNVGCIPSKAIISAARAMASVRNAAQFGVQVPAGVSIDFKQTMARMRRLRSEISPIDSVRRYTELGVDVFLGQGRFLDSETVEVDGTRLKFANAVIATGARAAAPPIAGLDQVPHLTNETLFSLTQLPARFGVLGAGPIGAEMAQSFARFGSQVTLVTSNRGLMPKEDRDAVRVVQSAMTRDGVRFVEGGREVILSKRAGHGVLMTHPHPEKGYAIEVDQLLIAAGRAPNVEGLDLEKVGVEYSSNGVRIDDHFRTTHPRIYAAGDICSPFQFTHAADFMARSVIRNALFNGRARRSRLVIPWTTYTSPELAQVGVTPESARQKGLEIDTYEQPMSHVDRAILEGETEGFVRIHTKKGTDRILGATLVAPHAGDLIGELSLAMTNRIGLGSIANAIHPYPTLGEAVRKVGDAYSKTRLTPAVAKLFKRWLAWRR